MTLGLADALYAAQLPLALMLGAVVLVTGRTPTARLLALFLVCDALSVLSSVTDLLGLGADRAASYTSVLLTDAGVFAWLLSYAAFVGAAADSPIARPLRARWVRASLLGGCAAVFVVPYVAPSWFLRGAGRFTGGAWAWDAAPGVTPTIAFLGIGVSTFALVASADAYARAPQGTTARTRAGWYAAAFALQDIANLVNYLPWVTHLPEADALLVDALWVGALVLLAYAVLRYQLFDIDLRVKLTLRRGTVAAAFVAVFFVVAQVAQAYLQNALGWLAGAVAAGLLLFMLAPLQRAAERLSDAAMPHVRASESYATFRKLEVYKATVESLAQDGAIAARERRALDALRAKLGIVESDARAVEADVVALTA